MANSERNGWIVGLVLIALGGVFLLQNAGVPVLLGNWWALFILIPAVAAFASAWTLYQQDRHFTPRVIGLITGGLVPLTIALIFRECGIGIGGGESRAARGLRAGN
jgi:hypothetical protein